MSKETQEMMIDMVSVEEPTQKRVENYQTRKALNKAGVTSFKANEGKIINVQNYYGDEQLVGRNYHDLNMFLEGLPDFNQNKDAVSKSQTSQNTAIKGIPVKKL